MEDKDYTISISWNVDDVLSLDDTLTIDQCIDVLVMAENNYDANHGISWGILWRYIDDIKLEDKMIIHKIVSALFKIEINPKEKTATIHDRSTLKKTNYCNISDKKMDQILLKKSQPLTRRKINNLIKIISE